MVDVVEHRATSVRPAEDDVAAHFLELVALAAGQGEDVWAVGATRVDVLDLGLGLAIARSHARAHGGDLVYDPGEHGACFELILPQP